MGAQGSKAQSGIGEGVSQDYYSILEIGESSNQEEIKASTMTSNSVNSVSSLDQGRKPSAGKLSSTILTRILPMWMGQPSDLLPYSRRTRYRILFDSVCVVRG